MSVPPPVQTYDQASLEWFTSELVAAGFEPVPSTSRRVWLGPAHPALAPLTEAKKMKIWIRDGWPIVFPYLFVDGLYTNHLTVGGYVCLWHEGDGSRDWVTLNGFLNRLVGWCQSAQRGWDPEGLAQDAQLNFEPRIPVVATFDFGALDISDAGEWGTFHGRHEHERLISLRTGPARPTKT